MKRFFYILFFCLIGNISFSQCPHNPTITSIPVMCPNSIDTLWTQAFDSYQWYMNGNPIGNATNQYFVVNSNIHAGSMFSVSATQNGCAEMSPQFLVDSWLFLPVTVMTVDNPPYCNGDTVLLVLNPPYELSIQWTNNGSPISGANDDSLYITNNGVYNVTAAPSICPNYIQSCVNIPISFINCSTSQVEIANSEEKINVFPNPVTDHIKFYLPDMSNYKVEIYDHHWKLHTEGEISIKSNEINISNLAQGVYYVIMKNNFLKRKHFRIVKI